MRTGRIQYWIYQGTGHRRRPRNAAATTQDSYVSETNFGDRTPTPGRTPPHQTVFHAAPPTITATRPDRTTGEATFLFWSQSDGRTASNHGDHDVYFEVGDRSVIAKVWYYLPAVSPIGPPGTPSVMIDAYSAVQNAFVDVDFADVTSDPKLTERANVEGDVPTTVSETIVARDLLASNNEHFGGWTTSPATTSASGDTLTCPEDSSGLAIATYHHVVLWAEEKLTGNEGKELPDPVSPAVSAAISPAINAAMPIVQTAAVIADDVLRKRTQAPGIDVAQQAPADTTKELAK